MKKAGIILVTAALSLCLPTHAADEAAKTAAYQSSVAQEQVRTSSQRLKQELLALVADYSSYGAASKELEQLKTVIQSLDHISEQDMAQVAQALATASRSEAASARGEIIKATADQKAIQSSLLGLADKLSQQADEATLQKRIEDLALRQSENLRATQRLIALSTAAQKPSNDVQRKAIEDHSLRKAEQTSLQNEIGLAVETLRKLTKSADPATSNHLTTSLAAANAGKLDQRTAAATATLESALPDSAAHQNIILQTLKTMADTLAASRTKEEQTRELAAAIDELAQKQEALAAKTPKLNDRNNDPASEAQQDIANRLDLLKERIEKLDKESAAKTDEAQDRSEKIAEKLAEKEFVKDTKNLGPTADAQKDVAEQLAKVSENLDKQADELAAADSPAEPAMSPEEQAIQDAMENLLDAKADNQIAGRQNDQKQDYSERLDQARQNLDQAQQNASKTGEETSKAVQEALNQAQKHAALAAAKKEPGHNLYHVNANIDKALATLQEAANQLATAQQKPESGDQNSGQMMEGEGTGGIGEAKGPPVTKRYIAGSASSEAQRDALSLLKQEKTSPDYEPMVNQYIKNLANDQ